MRVVLCGSTPEWSDLGRELGTRGFSPVVATTLAEMRSALRASGTRLAILDLDALGPAAIQTVLQEVPGADVVVVTSYDGSERAVEAMREGAADFVVRPVRAEELSVRLRQLALLRDQDDELDRIRALLGEDLHCPGILSDSPSMRVVCQQTALAVGGATPVLLTGEPGTGKEFVARAIHAGGPRRSRPWVTLSCRTLGCESETGSFADALLSANTGSILLDDVDALSLECQATLLGVMTEGRLVRQVSAEAPAIDVRVIATTETDLAAAVASGAMIPGLPHVLAGIVIHLPALRERGDDVLLLARRFLHVLAARRAEPSRALSYEAAEALCSYSWPGNVGELRRVVAAAHATAAGSEIGLQDLPEEMRRPSGASVRPFKLHLTDRMSVALPELVRQLEDEIRAWALAKAGGEPSRAAEILGEHPRGSGNPRR